MASNEHTFTLRDKRGESHEYKLTVHGAREALALAPDVALVFGRGLGNVLDAFGASGGEDEAPDENVAEKRQREARDSLDAGIDFGEEPDAADGPDIDFDAHDDLDDIPEHNPASIDDGDSFLDADLANINGAALGEAIVNFAEAFKDAGTYKIVMRLLRYTTRDGRALNKAPNFDGAFTGNLGECFFACFHALKFNFGDIVPVKSVPFRKR